MAQADASALLAKARAAKAAAGGTTTPAASTPSAESQASPETKAQVTEQKIATATEAQVNPPEEPKGGPATKKTPETRSTGSIERSLMAATVASGIIARGGVTDPKKVAQEAVKVTDAILEAL